MKHPRREKLLFYLSSITTALALLIVFTVVAAQMYVRWNLNQEFTFLGGFELEALTFSSFGLLLGLLYINSKNN